MADEVVVVFTREQAELAEVLFDDPFLYRYADSTKEVARTGRDAIRAGLNAHEQDPGCEPWVEAETGYNGPEAGER